MLQESLPSHPIRRARCAFTLLLCLCPLLLGGCLYGQRWERITASETRRPVTLKWEPTAPYQDLTAVTFIDESRGWAVGEAGTILHTADGGRSWQPQTSGTDQDLNTVFFLPDGLRGWAGGGNNHYELGTELNGVILHTRDGGKSWQPQYKRSEQLVSHLQFSPDGLRGWAAGSDTVLYTENGGLDWDSADSIPYGSYSSLFFLPDGKTGWAVGSAPESSATLTGIVVYTEDGGRNWEQRGSQPKTPFIGLQLSEDGKGLWVVGQRMPEGASYDDPNWFRRATGVILYQELGSPQFTPINSPAARDIRHVRFLPGGRKGWILADEKISYTEDGGRSWTVLASIPVSGLSYSQGTPRWAVGSGGAVLRSADGLRWQTMTSAPLLYPSAIFFLPGGKKGWIVANDEIQSSLGIGTPWIVGEGSSVLYSEDGGESWAALGERPDSLNAIYFLPDGQRGWAAGSLPSPGKGDAPGLPEASVILFTQDGGKTWAVQDSRPDLVILALQFWPDGRRGLALGVNQTDSGPESSSTLLYTEDGGRRWVRVEGLPATRLYGLYFTPDFSQGWAFGERIFSTEDGKHWREQYPAPPDSVLTGLQFLPDRQRGWAVGRTSERHSVIWRTTDGGKQWQAQYRDLDPELRLVRFLDDGQSGWALRLDSILYTADGGANWQTQLEIAAREIGLSKFHFDVNDAGVRGWAVGRAAIFRTVGESFHPLVEGHRINADLNRVEIQWRLKDEPADKISWKPENIKWTINYCVEDKTCSNPRRLVTEKALPLVTAGNDRYFSFSWNPADERVAEGTKIYYQITPYDGELHVPPQLIGPHEYMPWWKSLPPWLMGLAIVCMLLLLYLGLCFLLLWRHPLGLLWMHEHLPLREALEAWTPSSLKSLIPKTIYALTFLPWFAKHPRTVKAWSARYTRDDRPGLVELSSPLREHYRKDPGVLDAWVLRHVASARKVFESLDTVRQRRIHVFTESGLGLPGTADAVKAFRSLFEEGQPLVAITGSGGSGKSSLACQMGRWAMDQELAGRLIPHLMIPILIEQNISDIASRIRSQVKLMVGEEVEPELTESLLLNKRVLVILDGLSEKSADTQLQVQEVYVQVPVKALIVTSRRDVKVIGADKVTVHPEEITDSNVILFIREYLRLSGRAEILSRRQILTLVSRLLSITETRDGEVPITPLLVILLIDHAAEFAAAGQGIDELPYSIPETIVKYLERLSAGRGESVPDMIRATAVIARCSLGDEYVPQEFDGRRAVQALTQAGLWDGVHDPLATLVDGGVLEARRVGGVDFYRFKLDPVAEYMAALERVQTLSGDRRAWEDWLLNFENIEGFPLETEGFLLALQVCVTTYRDRFRIPELPWPSDDVLGGQ